MQPLDRSAFGPIKRFYNAGCDNWMRMPHNAARTITMHDIPGLFREAIQKGASISNIQSGFRATGICPLNEHVFDEVDFLISEMTDRINEPEPEPFVGGREEILHNDETHDDVKNLSAEQTLENRRPSPKAAPRKTTTQGRKKRKSAVLTDEAVIDALRKKQKNMAKTKEKQALAAMGKPEKKILNKFSEQKTILVAPKDVVKKRSIPDASDL